MTRRPPHALLPCSAPRHSAQRGVAALEFALVAMVMVALLLCLFVFWHALQTRQSLHRAAGDGARHALTLLSTGATPCAPVNAALHRASVEAMVETVIKRHLEQSGLPASSFMLLNAQWSCPAAGASSFSFDAEYQRPALLGGSWMAEPGNLQIREKIIVHFHPTT